MELLSEHSLAPATSCTPNNPANYKQISQMFSHHQRTLQERINNRLPPIYNMYLVYIGTNINSNAMTNENTALNHDQLHSLGYLQCSTLA